MLREAVAEGDLEKTRDAFLALLSENKAPSEIAREGILGLKDTLDAYLKGEKGIAHLIASKTALETLLAYLERDLGLKFERKALVISFGQESWVDSSIIASCLYSNAYRVVEMVGWSEEAKSFVKKFRPSVIAVVGKRVEPLPIMEKAIKELAKLKAKIVFSHPVKPFSEVDLYVEEPSDEMPRLLEVIGSWK